MEFLLLDGRNNKNTPAMWRNLCVQHIKNDPEKYSDVYLGRNADDYCEWLLLNSSWGGETEILILCELNNIQISVIQLETLVILTYSPPVMTERVERIYILYTGKHYDAIMDRKKNRYKFLFNDFEYSELSALTCARRHASKKERKRIQKKFVGCLARFRLFDE